MILFGEVFGSKIQNLSYGKVGTFGFAAFDLLVDGRYLDAGDFEAACARFGVPAVPVVYRGPFSLDAVKAVSGGNTTLGRRPHPRGRGRPPEGRAHRPQGRPGCPEVPRRRVPAGQGNLGYGRCLSR